jgi:hypothetical protein
MYDNRICFIIDLLKHEAFRLKTREIPKGPPHPFVEKNCSWQDYHRYLTVT